MVVAAEAHLLNLSISDAHQRRGHGTALLREATGIAREGGAQSLFLEVRPSNLAAIALPDLIAAQAAVREELGEPGEDPPRQHPLDLGDDPADGLVPVGLATALEAHPRHVEGGDLLHRERRAQAQAPRLQEAPGDLPPLARYITAEVELYKLKRNAPMPVEACATLTANILSGSRYYPYWVQLVIGGLDRNGGHVYSLDAAGGSLPDKYVSTGSGSPFVYGVLEDHWKDDMTVNEGADLAIRCITASMKRDSASGEGIDVAVITKDGFKTLDDKEVEKRKAAMKLT